MKRVARPPTRRKPHEVETCLRRVRLGGLAAAAIMEGGGLSYEARPKKSGKEPGHCAVEAMSGKAN